MTVGVSWMIWIRVGFCGSVCEPQSASPETVNRALTGNVLSALFTVCELHWLLDTQNHNVVDLVSSGDRSGFGTDGWSGLV